MIKYSLKCSEGHRFESWFADASTFDKLAAIGHLSCAVCGNDAVEKSIMAPRISSHGSAPEAASGADAVPSGSAPLSQPSSPAEQALALLKKQIERESEYVGRDFARLARAIHGGEEPNRSIYGEARIGDAKKLIDDGVPVAPLPFNPQRKTN